MSEPHAKDRPDPPEEPQPEEPPVDEQEAGEDQPAEEDDRPQDPWVARRELYLHAPTAFGGGLTAGDQIGMTGGRLHGDLIMGSKVENHFRLGSSTHTSGELPPSELAELAEVFVADTEHVDAALARLRDDRVLVLSGAPYTGRRSAALMLLHTLGAAPVRALDPKTRPTALKDELGAGARGYLLCDLTTDRDHPLRDIDLLGVREELVKEDAYLVVTIGLAASLSGVRPMPWQPPAPDAVLRAHLARRVGDAQRERMLLALEPAQDFVAHGHHQLREAARFAEALAAYARGELTEQTLSSFQAAAVTDQVQEWFGDEETPLRDKAFLIALAAFDEAPYALAAELSDELHAALQRTEHPGVRPLIPVFGTSITKRLRLARARGYEEMEHTEWGPVSQYKARFEEPLAAIVLLREVWTSYPSARPALIHWLRRLADDGRPLVRTRAAVTAAVLTYADLPSAMALLVHGWAGARRYRFCLVAANTLALAHSLGAPNVPSILRAWCDREQPDERLRWTAIRAYALVGAEMPEEALEALADAARAEGDDEEAEQIAESIALLLTAPAADTRSRVLSELAELVHDKPPVRRVTLRAFVLACEHTDDLLLLRWHAEAAASGGTADDRHLSALWRAALGDLSYTGDALQALRRWVHQADTDPTVESALLGLLPAIAVTADDRKRLSHLLRTLPAPHGGQPPQVAGRLLAAL
ncbi:hypothetical protein OG896_15120 [Streptomyces sp. NBC_00669]|uniref:hypothetical protein n=1 Tax=Streptomyces sp. NBC_00669 TaxID=2976011 RepID=UPI002E300834|nr:hypothetical protein [Streptomyces sp. NBC_00669]